MNYTNRLPALAVQGGTKRIIAVWESQDATSKSVKLRVIEPDGSMSQVYTVASGLPLSYSTTPSVAAQYVSGTPTNYHYYVLVTWYEGATQSLKGRIFRTNNSTFGNPSTIRSGVTQYSLLPYYYNTGWNIAWLQSGSLYHNYVTVSDPPALFSTPTTVVSGGSWTHTQPAIGYAGTQPTLTWRSTGPVVRISYSSRLSNGTWTTPQNWDMMYSNYQSPSQSINSYANADIVLAWQLNNSIIYTKKSGSSWTYLSTLQSSGTAPILSGGAGSASIYELIMSTSPTGSPYAIQNGVVDATYGGQMSKSEGGQPRLSNEGRGAIVGFKDGEMQLSVMEAVMNDVPIQFEVLNDTLFISHRDDFSKALRSQPFNGSGILKLSYYGVASGKIPQEASLKLVVKDVSTDGRLGVIHTFTGEKDFSRELNVQLKFPQKQIYLAIESNEISDNMNYKVERIFYGGDIETNGLDKKEIDVLELNEQVPTEFALNQNYPNPFNPTTTISYDLPQSGMVILKIYDALGREIKTLVNERKQIGRYALPFDGSSYSSGVYVMRLVVHSEEGKTFNQAKKMVLTK
ncbi:MAG: T9SS type A sorting domain-containing protein [Ignavibacteriales bacterium]|nr:T9SS type A sorting domain-containing protein [Ignavibacteriales bacterium]